MLDYQRLRVYQLSLQLAALGIGICGKIPRGAGKLSDQLFRSTTSIPANIAEGVGKRSKVERRTYYDHARGSAFETGAHLDVVRLLKCVADQDIDEGQAMVVGIVRMLTALLRS